jgi:DeoR/GlpR family transcriptional regulator of sugar metabolism
MSWAAAVGLLHVDISFVPAYGASGEYLCYQEEQVVAGEQAMLAPRERRVPFVRHSKLDRVALDQVCRLSSFDFVEVDGGASPGAPLRLEERKVPYELAPISAERSGRAHPLAPSNGGGLVE